MKRASLAILIMVALGVLFLPASVLHTVLAQGNGAFMTDNDQPGYANLTSTNNFSTSTNMTNTTSAGSNASGQSGSTFNAKGTIASLVFSTPNASSSTSTSSTNASNSSNATSAASNTTGNAISNTTTTTAATSNIPYVLSGSWSMSVSKGSVSDFKAAFTMVKIDGTGRHTHEITNMKTSNSSSIQLDKNGTTLIIGTADILSNGKNKWNSVDVIVSIDHLNVISIAPGSAATDNHFQGQPIYGVIGSLTDESGIKLFDYSTSGAVQYTNDKLNNLTDIAGRKVTEIGSSISNSSSSIANQTGNAVEKFVNQTGTTIEGLGDVIQNLINRQK